MEKKDQLEQNTDFYNLEIEKLQLKEKRREDRRLRYKKNANKVRAFIISLIIVILLFNFGFFRTLGISIVFFIGYLIGGYYDGNRVATLIVAKILQQFK